MNEQWNRRVWIENPILALESFANQHDAEPIACARFKSKKTMKYEFSFLVEPRDSKHQLVLSTWTTGDFEMDITYIRFVFKEVDQLGIFFNVQHVSLDDVSVFDLPSDWERNSE